METKEIKITPPEGYEVDKEKSTFDCIKFKKVVKRWKDDKTNKINGYYMNAMGIVLSYSGCNITTNYNVFAEKKQVESAIAMARISQIMANDERFGGVITDKEWNNTNICKYCIYRHNANKFDFNDSYHMYSYLAFHSAGQRYLFVKENRDLVKKYLMLD